MRTLIELYDERPLENVLSSQVFDPERTVFVCSREVYDSPRSRSTVRRYLEAKNCKSDVVFRPADMYQAEDVLRALEEICDTYEECVIDITGGTDAALFASGVLSARRSTPAFTYSRKTDCFYSISNAPFGPEKKCGVKLSVEDCFLMAGGAVKKGRVDNAILSHYMGFFKPFFDLFMHFKQDWTNIVNYMQRVSAPVNGEIRLDVDGAYFVKGDRGTIQANEKALEALRKIGFIRDLEIVREERVRFRFRDAQVRAWLRDVGSVLETYVYKCCLDTGLFDDVCTSVVVDWEGSLKQGDVTNELDVMATRGIMPVFISCKTGEIRTEAINELSVLRDRFGGRIARAAIVSASKCQLITRNRAHELDIDVIDAEDLKRGRLPERLKSLARQFD